MWLEEGDFNKHEPLNCNGFGNNHDKEESSPVITPCCGVKPNARSRNLNTWSFLSEKY